MSITAGDGIFGEPFACAPGTDTESCCWWGRGGIGLTGPGPIGDFQAEYVSQIPALSHVDACANPGAICEEPGLRWAVAVYFWGKYVQEYPEFKTSIQKYVDAGFVNAGTSTGGATFAEGCNNAVNWGDWDRTAFLPEKRLGKFYMNINALKHAGMGATATEPSTEGGCYAGKVSSWAAVKQGENVYWCTDTVCKASLPANRRVWTLDVARPAGLSKLASLQTSDGTFSFASDGAITFESLDNETFRFPACCECQ
jgi:hypothetical protein